MSVAKKGQKRRISHHPKKQISDILVEFIRIFEQIYENKKN